MAITEALARLAALLDRQGLRWYLFGAQAAVLHGASRLSVISPEDLVVTKILAGRPKDLEDVTSDRSDLAVTLDRLSGRV